ncbi:MAG: glycosyltransferase [Planctomycetaceae bacterium]|nr:glycosyltransferase [Planctomycetaceae bacterium]
MKVAFVVGGLYHRANGVAWIMRDLAHAIQNLGNTVQVYAAECARPGHSSIGEIFDAPVHWISEPGKWLGGLSWSPALRSRLRSEIASADVVHNHSIWMLPNHYAASAARAAGVPVIYTTHGTLEPWALAHSRWKKSIVGWWFQYEDLRRADCLHVNSHSEMRAVRDLGYSNPVAVIPNGINPIDDHYCDPTDFVARHPELIGKRCILFLARLHAKKGLAHLLGAWKILANDFPEWHLILAGPDDGFESTCREIVSDGLSNRVTFTGHLGGDQKQIVRQLSEFLVQPSFSEGFSMSVVEALYARLPVVITPGCNFPEATEAGAGRLTQPDTKSTEEAMRQLINLSDDERRAMGELGRKLVLNFYTWPRVAEATLQLYQWMAGRCEQPDFVFTY